MNPNTTLIAFLATLLAIVTVFFLTFEGDEAGKNIAIGLVGVLGALARDLRPGGGEA